jgi:hypothetical protein
MSAGTDAPNITFARSGVVQNLPFLSDTQTRGSGRTLWAGS